MKKHRILKIIGIAAIVLAIVAIVGGIFLYAGRNAIARKGIIEALSYNLQVDVQLKKVSLSPFKGAVSLEGFVIGNPEGFDGKELFSADKIDVALDIKSFRTDEPTIKLISMKNASVTLEQKLSGSNISKLIDNASRLQGEKKEEAPKEKQAASDKKIKIEKILLEGTKAGVVAPFTGGKALAVPIPRIEMNDLGGNKEPMKIPQAIGAFFKEIVKSILSAGKSILPADFDKQIGAAVSGATEAVGKAGEKVLDSVGDAAKGIGGLLKKDKK